MQGHRRVWLGRMPITHGLHDGPVKVLKSSEDRLLDPRESLANGVPSHIIEQANQC